MVQYGSMWFNMVQYGSIWFNMVQYGSMWFNMVQYGSIWFNMVQYGSIWFNPPFSKIKSSNQPNIESTISSHNRKILHPPVNI